MESLQKPAWLIGFPVVVTLSALISVGFQSDLDPIPMFWPCNGLVLATLLVRRPSDWTPIMAMAWPSISLAEWIADGRISPDSAIATLEPLLAALVYRRLTSTFGTATAFVTWLQLIVSGPLLASGLTAAISASMPAREGTEYAFVLLARSWWSAHALGFLLMTPAIHFVLLAIRSRGMKERLLAQKLELAAFAAAFLSFTWFVFGPDAGASRLLEPLEHAILPILLWSVLRFPSWISLSAIPLYSGVAAWQTALGNGPFSAHGSGAWEPSLVFQASALTLALGLQLALVLTLDRRWISRDLEQRNRLFRDILESTNEWIWEVDADLRFVYSSAHSVQLIGRSPDELLGTKSTDLVLEEDRPIVAKAFAERVALGLPIHGVVHRDRHTNGRIVHLESNVVPILAADGSLIGCRGMDRDISDRIAAEEDARRLGEAYTQSEKLSALGAIASGVAHEINNPNQFITLNMPILKQAWADVAPAIETHAKSCPDWTIAAIAPNEAVGEIDEVIDEVTSGSDRIRSIVCSLRDFLRGDVVRVREPVEPGECVRSVVNLVSRTFAARGQRLDVEIEPIASRILGHRARIEQVLINLMLNASEAIGDGPGTISVGVRESPDGRFVSIYVGDDGIGIADVDLIRVTEPFYTTRRQSGGMGLGLSISQQIAHEHDGRLEIESELGEGTTVRLILPVSLPGVGAPSH